MALSAGYLARSGGKSGIADFYNLFLLILEYNEGVALKQTLLKGILGELIIKNILSWLTMQFWPYLLFICQQVQRNSGFQIFTIFFCSY